MSELGVVVIGRNEGARLVRCLESVAGGGRPVVYVDSGSTDGSPSAARRLGAEVVALDMSLPFTAARARNAGLHRLLERRPDLALVQLVDGDCEVQPGWLEAGAWAMAADPRLGVVCGRTKERHPTATVYNRLIDVEWDGPLGDIPATTGNAMARVAALRQAGWFRADLIAGEEPELCLRVRRLGWRVARIDADMAVHDAAMTRLGQWWRRTVRAGHAYAEGAHLHGAGPERHWVRETRRAVLWGGILPAAALGGAPLTLGASLLLGLAYPACAARVYARTRGRGRSRADAAAYAAFTVLGKLPELQGVLRFHRRRLLGGGARLIEYRGDAAPAGRERAAA
ncbi:MAG: glycosyltransferase family 2 protein [Planctomycetes bacterium]|nr:glycosyltransferase family 2 protein [Planctomycetota bacterium]